MRLALIMVLGASLAACSGGDHQDLRDWMRDASKDLRGNTPKLPEVQPYKAVPYEAEAMLDPFKQAKIEPESKNRPGRGKGGPDFEAREIRNSLLEKFPLESLKMIGFLNVNNRPVAVIQADQNVKQIKLGEYMGLDFGMVTKITDTEVTLRELVQDSAGDWSERTSSLHLQSMEGTK